MTASIRLLYDAPPPHGTRLQVAPGVYWLRMPLPVALDHINLWLLEDEGGWTVVDTGVANDATRAAWERVIDTALDGKPVVRVLCTHMHPDHIGLADWLCRRFDAPLWITTGEYLSGRAIAAGLPGTDTAAQIAHYVRHGVDAEQLAAITERGSFYQRMVPAMPHAYRRISDGERVRIGAHDWRVLVGTGHSPEHASLACEALNLVISGDMLLPTISTNVSVWAIEPEANPLAWFLESITHYRHLHASVRVLPSHGLPFEGAHARVDALEAHHAARLTEVRAACADQAQTAAGIVPLLFRRKLDIHQTTFALGEALAHLHALWFAGELVRETDAHGTVRFRGV